MAMMISVSYILLCGQFVLLLTVILLQCLGGIHSQNSTNNLSTSTVSPGQGATTIPVSEQPEHESVEPPADNSTEVFEYRPPSPVVLCSYL